MTDHLSAAATAVDMHALESNDTIIETLVADPPEPRRSGRVRELQSQVHRLLTGLRLAVVYGGDKEADGAVLFKSQNTRSWKSYETVARDIAESLERLGAQDVVVLPDDMRLADALREHQIDYAWLNTGGVQGRAPCAHAAAMLEMLGVPYVGHDPMTAAILDAKHTFKRLMIGAGVPTAPFMTWNGGKGRFDPTTNAKFRDAFGAYQGPFIVKPVSGRASLNVEYAPCLEALAETFEDVFAKTQNDVLIEKYLGGREFCVAAAGPLISKGGVLQRLDSPFIFGFVERVLGEDERVFTSMDHKPITGERVKNLDPREDATVIQELRVLAERVFEELEVQTLIRLDVRADNEGKLHVLETNPKPDLKAPTVSGVISIVSSGLERCEMSYDDLILSLFADSVDTLLSKRNESARHLLELLES